MSSGLDAPLLFAPVYQTLVWGGRRLEKWRTDLPPGPVGESWDLADHERGMSVVAHGALVGRTLRSLVESDADALLGSRFSGRTFPLMVKLIDASDRLSVQVHPDDTLAKSLGLGDYGKTECWLLLTNGGFLYQGTRPGVDRSAFEAALEAGTLERTLNRYEVATGDFFFLEARTVHALGAGCLLYEIQQTSDVTFRVYDWGRVGLDGKPRPLHVSESLETIDFSRAGFGPRRPAWRTERDGGEARTLVDCPQFVVEERRSLGRPVEGTATEGCAIVIGLDGAGRLETTGGGVPLRPMQTALVPAAAGPWTFVPETPTARLLTARPRF